MKRKIIITMLLSAMLAGVYAQDSLKKAKTTGFVPAKGDFSGAILFGRANFLTIPDSDIPTAPGNNSNWTVVGTAPINNTVGADNNNTITNIVGGEGRYFLKDDIALKFSGAGIVSGTPSRVNLPAVILATDAQGNQFLINPNSNASWIPAYAAVKAENQVTLNFNVGAEKHFATKYNRLSPYVGLTIPYYYARKTQYDPTINDAVPVDNPGYIVDIGIRQVQLMGFGLQAVAGIDYYLMEGFYIGFEIKPISYVYSYTSKKPAPGLPLLKSDNNNWSFLSQTFFKIGFRF